jgi:hypothetical protein
MSQYFCSVGTRARCHTLGPWLSERRDADRHSFGLPEAAAAAARLVADVVMGSGEASVNARRRAEGFTSTELYLFFLEVAQFAS